MSAAVPVPAPAPPLVDPAAAGEMAREAAAWCALHGLVVGDRADPVSYFFLGGFLPLPLSCASTAR